MRVLAYLVQGVSFLIVYGAAGAPPIISGQMLGIFVGLVLASISTTLRREFPHWPFEIRWRPQNEGEKRT